MPGHNDSAFCHNCGIRLTGPYCAACGQKAVSLSVTLHDFVHELTHETLHVDGRIFQSIRRLLLSPGFLTREYVQGHRARWISPIRLYLIFSVIYFALGAFTGFRAGVYEHERPRSGSSFSLRSAPLEGLTADDDVDDDEARGLGFENAAAMRDTVNHAILTWIPRVMFVLLPLFAWLVALAYRSIDSNYLHHLIFSVHVHAAWFAAGVVAKAVELVSRSAGQALERLVLAFAVMYVVLACRRVYGKVRFGAARIAFVLVAYLVAFIAAFIAVIIPAIFGQLLRERMRTSLLLIVTVLTATAAFAQAPTVREDPNIYGRPGWVLENGRVRVALLRGGGHIAELRLISTNPRLSINPMFMPQGTGYMGHLVAFPHYGPASAEERAQGLSGHGEAGSVEWQQTRPPQIDAKSLTFFYGADLPKTQYKIERAVTLTAGESTVRVEEWIENLAPYDRPYNRNQHATFGAPFVTPGRNILDMSGTRGITDPKRTGGSKWAEGRLFQWPDPPPPVPDYGGQAPLSFRDFHAIPGGQVYTPVLTDRSEPQSWFTVYNADYPLLVGYVFPTDDHPWIIDWQNQPRADTSAGMARGIEFGTSPFDEGLRKSVERAQLLGVPTYKFIGARQRLSTTFTIFLREIPQDFKGVANVALENGRVVVSAR